MLPEMALSARRLADRQTSPARYWMTSVASSVTVGGSVSPSARAVWIAY